MKVGDVVQLKSGGPAMTVIFTNLGLEAAVCAWGDGQRAQFPFDSLKPFVEDRPSLAMEVPAYQDFGEWPLRTTDK